MIGMGAQEGGIVWRGGSHLRVVAVTLAAVTVTKAEAGTEVTLERQLQLLLLLLLSLLPRSPWLGT